MKTCVARGASGAACGSSRPCRKDLQCRGYVPSHNGVPEKQGACGDRGKAGEPCIDQALVVPQLRIAGIVVEIDLYGVRRPQLTQGQVATHVQHQRRGVRAVDHTSVCGSGDDCARYAEVSADALEVRALFVGRAVDLLDQQHIESEALEAADERDSSPGVAAVAGPGRERGAHDSEPSPSCQARTAGTRA